MAAVEGWLNPLQDKRPLLVGVQVYAVRNLPFPFSERRRRGLTARLQLGNELPDEYLHPGETEARFEIPAGDMRLSATVTVELQARLAKLVSSSSSPLQTVGVQDGRVSMPILPALLSRPCYSYAVWLPLGPHTNPASSEPSESASEQQLLGGRRSSAVFEDGGEEAAEQQPMLLVRLSCQPKEHSSGCSEDGGGGKRSRLLQQFANETMFFDSGGCCERLAAQLSIEDPTCQLQ